MIPEVSSPGTLLKTEGGHFSQTHSSHQQLTTVMHKTVLREARRLGTLMGSFVWICCSGTSIVMYRYEV